MADANINVVDPATMKFGSGARPAMAGGPSGDGLVSRVHGKFYNANYYGHVFNAFNAAATIKASANNVAMTAGWSLYNPPGSGINVEFISTDIGSVSATTVVNTIGLYIMQGKAANAATFATVGVGGTNNFPGNLSNALGGMYSKALYYTSCTASGTPVLWKIIGSTWATSSTAAFSMRREFDGTAIAPPGTLISVLTTTAAETTTGLAVDICWSEWPI